MNLPLELKSKVFDGASSLDEYKKIRLASELNDKELELLIEHEYNKKLREAQDNIKKSKELHSKLPLIAQLYFLRNPIKKYNLLEYNHNDSQIYYLMTGTKTQILNLIKEQAKERLENYNTLEYVGQEDMVDVDKEVEKAMIQYAKDVSNQINELKLGSNVTTLINQSEMTYHDEDHSIYYIITETGC